jgi:colicin import membrane protein
MVRTAKAARTTKNPARASSRAKTDVQEEFDEIQTEVAEHAPPDLKMVETARLREAEGRASIDGISVERVVQKISGLGLEISRALTQVSEQLVDQVNELERGARCWRSKRPSWSGCIRSMSQ